MKKIISSSLVLGAVPMFAFAAGLASAESIIAKVHFLLNSIIPVLIAFAVVYFIWGVIQYTLSTDEEAKSGARMKIINGLIGLFVIVSFWGIIAIITNTFGVGPTDFRSNNHVPCIPGPGVLCQLK